MAFTPEDGTGIVGANAYIDVANFKAYHDDRGNVYTVLLPTDPDIEKAIIKATDYIETRWACSFKGKKEFPDNPQGLSWPRLNVVDLDGEDITGVPLLIEKATAEYALRVASASLAPDPTIDDSNRPVTMEKVGPIETKFSDGTFIQKWRDYPAVDALIKPLIIGGGQRFTIRA
ncbi:MAG: hypothetical protein DRP45_09205 [Candidatus Zixiibacteriota bacterium]|nr:MAG: hypothetical protein DRP45_09205 [candidate division Zixibacteria bacterium]